MFLEVLLCNCEQYTKKSYTLSIVSWFCDKSDLDGISSNLSNGLYCVSVFTLYSAEEEIIK